MPYPYARFRLLGICVLICLLSLLGSSCTRELISIISIEMRPVVSVHYRTGFDSYLAEGMSVLISVDDIDSDANYQVTVSAPDGQITWEQMVRPFTESEQWFLGLPHVTLPPDFSLPQGQWNVEVLASDGSRVEKTFIYQKSLEKISLAQLAVANLPELNWEEDGERWKLSGVPPLEDGIWSYQFFNPDGSIIHTTDSQKIENDPLIMKGTLIDRTHHIVGMRYDEQMGVYLMMRQVVREFDQQTATTVDE